jgi:hypothetical protein
MSASTRTLVVRFASMAMAAAAMLAACTSSIPLGSPESPPTPRATGGSPVAIPTTAPDASPESSPQPVTMARADRCPVTIPRARGPAEGTYRDGRLRVALWPRGVIAVGPAYVDRSGRVVMKFPWWRRVSGRLHITGRRLDGPSPPALARVPFGYGRIGFQSSAVTFPREGCWEVTGTVGRTRLTFVTFVIKRGPHGA